ncbi:hypothetical protein STVA_20700 [Allostella vacuolata]|nr:hypothetical protein STVA_20700 [Stella vacuolata]
MLGGTGSIGAPILRWLAARGHEAIVLARSDASAAAATRLGAASIVRGDIAAPDCWVGALPDLDAVVHMACDFAGPMAAVDGVLIDALLPRLAAQPDRPRFVYTGGCWLFGATGDVVATEKTPMSPLPAFAWMVPHAERILGSQAVDGIVIHPAMVYGDGAGGVFRRFAREAVDRPAIRVVGGEAVRWPLVHCDDLAQLYGLALERAPRGASYIGAAVEGLAVGRIARAFAGRFGTPERTPAVISADSIALELGPWARGYALDQRLSGAKARRELGWAPRHLDPEAEIAALP